MVNKQLKKIHERIKWAIENSFGYERVAEKMHKAPSTIYNYCTEGGAPDKFSVLKQIAKVTGFSWIWIVTGKGNPKDPIPWLSKTHTNILRFYENMTDEKKYHFYNFFIMGDKPSPQF